MLIALSVRDFVLIDALDVSVHRGFTSITGETGAGKSIMLEALRFVLGGKADKRLIRNGAERTSVSASFELPSDHPALAELYDRGFDSAEEGVLTLRRVLSANGPSRVFANDQMISADLARTLGESLVEIHGQHDSSALLNPALHKSVLDQYAQSGKLIETVSKAYDSWQAAREELETLEAEANSRESELAQLQIMLDELDTLSPQEGEASRLTSERAFLMNGQKLAECLTDADDAVRQSDAANVFGTVSRHLERALRLPELAEAREDSPQLEALKTAQDAVERVLIELSEASFAVESARSAFDYDAGALEGVETRLFALRAAGRKFGVDPDALCELHMESKARLQKLGDFEFHMDGARSKVAKEEAAYCEVAGKLTALRQSSAKQLAKLVMKELKPLKLEHAVFQVRIDEKPLEAAGPDGRDKIVFEVQTNPGAPFGAMNQIASGGELARFTLALRVCLANVQTASLIVFDEADQGVGGAVASAVGERLSRLAEERQVISITHSPQVASCGHFHWHVTKAVSKDKQTTSKLTVLSTEKRLEEVARMLSGSEVTKEARAAAESLMAGAV